MKTGQTRAEQVGSLVSSARIQNKHINIYECTLLNTVRRFIIKEITEE
jgi:hypothetical protein